MKQTSTLGGLHIEMAVWNAFGDYLEISGWTTAFVQAEVAFSGTANSLLTRTRHAHQVTLLALCTLQEEAFKHINGSYDCDDDLKETWRQSMIEYFQCFSNWDTIFRMELIVT